MTLKVDRWPLKTYRHLFNAISRFVHHFVAMGKFKLELKSGNAHLGWKSAFLLHMNLKLDRWPNKMIGHIFYATPSFVHRQFKLEFQSGNAQLVSKLANFCPVGPWNLTDDLEKQTGTSPMLLKALCIIPSPYVNSNSNYGPKTTKLFLPLCPWALTPDLDLWHRHGLSQW